MCVSLIETIVSVYGLIEHLPFTLTTKMSKTMRVDRCNVRLPCSINWYFAFRIAVRNGWQRWNFSFVLRFSRFFIRNFVLKKKRKMLQYYNKMFSHNKLFKNKKPFILWIVVCAWKSVNKCIFFICLFSKITMLLIT